MAPKKPKSVKPLEQLDALLPAITNDELLEFLTRTFEQGAERATNYADLLDDSEASRDVLNEGLAFAVRLDELFPMLSLRGSARIWNATRKVDRALEDLKLQNEGVRSGA